MSHLSPLLLACFLACCFSLAPAAEATPAAVEAAETAAPAAEAETTDEAETTAPVVDEAPEAAGDEAAPAADEAAADDEGSDEEVLTGATFYEKLKQGGIIVLILMLISVALLSFAIERLQNLKRSAIMPVGFAEQARKLWSERKFKQLRQFSEASNSTIGSVVRALVMHRKSNPLELSQVAGDIASSDMREHMQRLIPFALIATISPLLGLLGTVSGMIESFEVVAIAGSLGDASVLADGIAKALITTAVGLIVAVPAIALFNLFKARTTRIALALDSEVNMLIGEWFMEEVDDEDEGDQ
ncbi:MAG: MotA/TolQ/ExbB proton channel family protein [Planctomycetota bacterium]|jgi:biopolymer transport protein ExbB|nr:MotA/TolQ/ExbB proton channel family protein [Planctomycetota bacterium]